MTESLAELQKDRKEIVELIRERDSFRQQMDRLNQERDACRQEMFESNRYAARLALERQKLIEQNSQLRSNYEAQIAGYEARITAYEARVAALTSSTSWRLTTPIRGLRRALGRLVYLLSGSSA